MNFFENTYYTLHDRRTNWKFKILNILTNDRLREALSEIACSNMSIRDMLESYSVTDSEKKLQLVIQKALARNSDQIRESLNNIFYI